MSVTTFERFADSPAYRDALAIVDALTSKGHVAYFAGGCVRDALLGHEPKDYDVATSATPDAVRGLFRRSQGVGESFGVILVRQPATHVEVATFRSDGDYTDGRRPDRVTFSDEVHDALRRDFTINGMFFDPRAARVIDHVGGQTDLAARLVRAIGDPAARFAEDYLRILRAVRFAARLGFTIEPTTRAAIETHVGKLTRIAPERIADELRRMLVAPSAAEACDRFDALGIGDVLFRRVDGSARIPSAAGAMLRNLDAPISFPLALAAIVASRLLAAGRTPAQIVAPDSVRRIDVALRETLHYSNDDGAGVRGALGWHALLADVPPRIATLKRFLAGPFSADARRLFRLVAPATRIAEIDAIVAGFGDVDVAPPPMVTGDDLVAMGFAPSPLFKRVLDATYDAQLESAVTSPDAARSMARQLMSA